MTLKKLATEHPLALFFSLAYGLAWLCWLPLVLSQTGLGFLPVKIPMAYTVIGSYAPLAAALLTQWFAQHQLKFFRLIVFPKRILSGLGVGVLLITMAFIFLPSLILTKPPFSVWDWKAFLLYPAAVVHSIFLAAGPLGEEPGWRGFALPRLLKRSNPSLASLILGVLWFAWHLPLFLLPDWTSSPLPVYALLVISLSFIMTFVYHLSKGNILIAIVTHALFNASPVILNAFLARANTKNFISFELLLSLSFFITALLLILVTRSKLGYVPSSNRDNNQLN